MYQKIHNFRVGEQSFAADIPICLQYSPPGNIEYTVWQGAPFQACDLAIIQQVKDQYNNPSLVLYPNDIDEGFLIVNGQPAYPGNTIALGRYNLLSVGIVPGFTTETEVFIEYRMKTSVKITISILLLSIISVMMIASKHLIEYNDYIEMGKFYAGKGTVGEAFAALDSAQIVEQRLGILTVILNSDDKALTRLNMNYKEQMYRAAEQGICPTDLNPEFFQYVQLTREDSLLFNFICEKENTLNKMTDLLLNKNGREQSYQRWKELDMGMQIKDIPKTFSTAPKTKGFNMEDELDDYKTRSATLVKLILKRDDYNKARKASSRIGIVQQMITNAFRPDAITPDIYSNKEAFCRLFEDMLDEAFALDSNPDNRLREQYENAKASIHH
ncbi:MAG: hypothetical protein DYG98_22375 [Haliscomenobacteraceae bacterium CHB4]|nr:hypothetical protein [Saprospiraceae bacterium]MCE7925806.1 hypothetical protein [Haliscomenobacteraceae bacterium CHB4]